jgi:hypothetical protein
MKCAACDREVEPSPNTGRVGKWNVMKASREGWFFQKDDTAWCPDHVPDWVAAWRARQKP